MTKEEQLLEDSKKRKRVIEILKLELKLEDKLKELKCELQELGMEYNDDGSTTFRTTIPLYRQEI